MGDRIDGNSFLQTVRPALTCGDAGMLADIVKRRWRAHEVASLLRATCVDARRVAAMTLGLVGTMDQVPALARALRDVDEQVNQMADYAMWSIWFRSGSAAAAPAFREGVACLESEQYAKAVGLFERALRLDPDFAEAYNQCALAHFFLGDYQRSLRASCQAVQRVPEHFGAIAGAGHCYAQMDELEKAMHCYRRALRINPRMPGIAGALSELEKRIDTPAQAMPADVEAQLLVGPARRSFL